MARVGLVLLALGPILAAAYAGVNRLAIQEGAKAQVNGPEWEGGRVGADGLTSLGAEAWQLVWWTALLVSVVALAYVAIGVLLRRPGRGRTFLLVLSGFLILPYALGFLIAFIDPVRLLAGLRDAGDFVDGLPPWQEATPFLLLTGGLVQAVGMVLVNRRPAERPKEKNTPATP
ncbi:hypothetical protein [Nonomuraea sp. SYSU D8015]|uniref:hypothetical protein n=1 Tax=Nonomuraea sp. SYSU D8015 TaxID=2593644 RepID=UPI0016606261|nr:hypothetical protein [Nonomuraea sp. SYSU D8015]